MRKFIVKAMFFSVIPFFYFGTNMIINQRIYHKQVAPVKEISIIIAGDSHPQKSLNPIFFENAQNISQFAEPYIMTIRQEAIKIK